MKRLRVLGAVATLLTVVVLGAAPAGAQDCRWPHDSADLPETIALPNGFQPEGVTFGYGPVIYAGSLADGAIYAANVLTGEGGILAEGETGRISVGLAFDERTGRLYVAGGTTGLARVHDSATGELGAEVTLSAAPTFVNDVDVADDAAWFTDSRRPVLYRMSLTDPNQVDEVPLGGDFVFEEGAINANGIVAARSGELLVVNTARAELYRVDPASGAATVVDVGGASLVNGDGLVLRGDRLWAVQNRLNQVSVFDLADDLASAQLVEVLTSDRFRIPTTADLYGSSLYAVNARFGTPPGPDVDYDIVRVDAGSGYGSGGDRHRY